MSESTVEQPECDYFFNNAEARAKVSASAEKEGRLEAFDRAVVEPVGEE